MDKEEWERILIKHRVYLVGKLTPADLWNYMIARELITKDQRERITSENHAESDQVGAILDHIGKKNEAAFLEFRDIIDQIGSGFVLDKILEGTSYSVSHKQHEHIPLADREVAEPLLSMDQTSLSCKQSTDAEHDDIINQNPADTVEGVQPMEIESENSKQDMNDGAGSNPTYCCRVPQYCKKHKNVIMIAAAALLFTVVAAIAVPLVITSDENTLQATGNPTVLPYSVKLDINEACGGNNTLYRLHDAQGDSRCQSNSGNGFSEDPRSCSKFQFCCQRDSQRGDGSCPEHYTFHPESQTCEFTTKTYFRDPYDCGKYHRCFQDDTYPARRFEYQCNTDLYFGMDKTEPTCAHKEQVFDCIQPATVPTTSQGVDNLT